MSEIKLTQTGVSVDIGIEETNRKAVADSLTQLLADEHVLTIKTRNYHWNVTGMQFQQIHELFGEQYATLAEANDDIAERIRTLGFFSAGSMQEFLKNCRLSESDHVNGDAQKMINNLLRDHEAIIQFLRHDLDEAMEVYKDAGTSDFLTGLMEVHEKMAWMLRSHIG
ncbi:MAG: DNA starvation/stationary phase protection protein [Saprospiraceae bacterium]|nr:MAG: DNA starvation/stationary phase protection protein [Saprospiraceae bacterium]